MDVINNSFGVVGTWVGPSNFTFHTQIDLPESTCAAGLEIVADSSQGIVTVSAFGPEGLLGSVDVFVPAPTASVFVGFDGPPTAITMITINDGGRIVSELIDNLRFATQCISDEDSHAPTPGGGPGPDGRDGSPSDTGRRCAGDAPRR